MPAGSLIPRRRRGVWIWTQGALVAAGRPRWPRRREPRPSSRLSFTLCCAIGLPMPLSPPPLPLCAPSLKLVLANARSAFYSGFSGCSGETLGSREFLTPPPLPFALPTATAITPCRNDSEPRALLPAVSETTVKTALGHPPPGARHPFSKGQLAPEGPPGLPSRTAPHPPPLLRWNPGAPDPKSRPRAPRPLLPPPQMHKTAGPR